MNRNFYKQKGYLLVVSILMIVVVGFISAAVASIFFGGAVSTGALYQSSRALYLAESGLEHVTHKLLQPSIANRISCTSLNATPIPATSFGAGEYQVNLTSPATSASYVSTPTTLTSSITASATTINVASTADYQNSGRIQIDKEFMDYTGKTATSFTGVTRGADLSLASSHAVGAPVSQYQCNVTSIGAIPSIATSQAKRTLTENIQLQEGWAVGPRNVNNFVFAHWNQPNELVWNNGEILDNTNREDLTSISMLSSAQGWAVGTSRNNEFTIVQKNGASWVSVPAGLKTYPCTNNNASLQSVSSVSSQEAWAVGIRYGNNGGNCNNTNRRFLIAKWNGTSWFYLTSATTPSIPADSNSAAIQNLNGVHVIDTNGDGLGNIGFGVGVNGTIVRYNGVNWTIDPQSQVITANTLNKVFVVSATEAWAIGVNGTILKWNGNTWSVVASPTVNTLYGIVMLDTNSDGLADVGWAVGLNGTTLHYVNGAWSLGSTVSGAPALIDVDMYNDNDVWAVGTLVGANNTFHWTGSAWIGMTSNTPLTLYSISLIHTKKYPFSHWQENFN